MSDASIASIGILPSSTIRSTHYCPRSRKSNGEKGGGQLTHRKRLLGRSCLWTRTKMIRRASSLVGNLGASSPSPTPALSNVAQNLRVHAGFSRGPPPQSRYCTGSVPTVRGAGTQGNRHGSKQEAHGGASARKFYAR
jgi:hypothetical protein